MHFISAPPTIKIARECLRSDVKVHALHLVHNCIIIFIAADHLLFPLYIRQPLPSLHSTTLLSDIIYIKIKLYM